VLTLAIPLLHVTSSAAAEHFYCRRLGFRLEFAHRAEGSKPDPCYMGITRDRVWLHISSFSGDGISGNVANLMVDDVYSLHSEFVAQGVMIDPDHPVDQTWGTREMYVKDPDGNTLRFIQG
jgi:catechol 2,3-dioxygenase-like lactoylglutathione lyase family enzyme